MKTYKITAICTNCGDVPTDGQNLSTEGHGEYYLKNFEIPKGTLVVDFLHDKTCKNCGCVGYMIQNQEEK